MNKDTLYLLAAVVLGGAAVWWLQKHSQAAAPPALPTPGQVMAAPLLFAQPAGSVPPNMLRGVDGILLPKPDWWDNPNTTALQRLDYLAPPRPVYR